MFPLSKSLALCNQSDVPFYIFPQIHDLGFVKHGFSTRLGGVSQGIFASMNLSFTRGDAEEAVLENFKRFCGAIGTDYKKTVISSQEHHTTVLAIRQEDAGRGVTRDRGYTDVDGMMTDVPGIVLCTQYADCVPLFFADPVRKVVATSHAGWKGTVDGMAAVTVQRMGEVYGCDPADIRVGIGPSIGMCCFEVDAPVYERFAALPFADEQCIHDDQNGKYHIDLWESNRRFLLQSGVQPQHITVTDLCTKCHPDVFWSHRITGPERGSLAAFISIAEDNV